ncbi:NAD(P)H-dependent oxidoreductase [Sphingobium sp. SJ10-10]
MADTPTRHKIAILVGSLRKGSINRKIARSICSLASDKLDCEIIEIWALAPFNQDEEAAPPAEYARFRERVAAADGCCSARRNIIAACPAS